MVVIFGLKEHLAVSRALLSEAIHQCLVSVLKLPEEKRFQRFVGLERADFIFPPDRSDAYTVIELKLMEGRGIETKKALIRALFERIEREVGIVPRDVEITILEQPAHAWGFRGMLGDEAHLNYTVGV